MATRAPPKGKTIRSLIAAGFASQKKEPLPTGCVRAFNATRARTDADVLDLLTDALVAGIARVPVDGELWDVEDCAAYLDIDLAAFQRLRNRRDFPATRTLCHEPLWLAAEMIEWAKDHPRRAARKRKG